MPSFRSTLALAVMVVMLAGTFHTIRQDFARRAAADRAALAEIGEIWHGYQMPMPPQDAPLVRFGIKPRTDWHIFPGVGFLVRKTTHPPSGAVLCGDQLLESATDSFDPIAPPPGGSLPIDLAVPEGILGISTFFGLAVQCQTRGWTVLGTRFYKIAAGGRPAASDLGYQLVWQHLLAEVLRPGSDRPALAAKMKRLLDAGHDLPQAKGTQIYEPLIANNPSVSAAPETIIAGMLAERLVSSRIIYDYISVDAPLHDPFYDLEDMGFAAVPVLLNHLDDDRPTGRMTAAMFGKMVSQPIQVKDLASELLRRILGNRLHQYGRQPSTRGNTFEALVTVVWEQAKVMGEEAWLVDGAPASEDEANWFPNECHLRLLQSRYPGRLPEILRFQLQHRPKAVIHPIITALAGSRLPSPEKLTLLKEAAALEGNPDTRSTALEAIQQLDPDYFKKEAIGEFDRLAPATTLAHMSAHQSFVWRLAHLFDDPEVWAAILRAAQRAEPLLRMELIDTTAGFNPQPHNKSQRLQFLAAFLDDLTERSLEEPQFYGAWAARDIPILRVGDLAAMQAARIMGWPDRPDETWTRDRWDHLRGRVARLLRQ